MVPVVGAVSHGIRSAVGRRHQALIGLPIIALGLAAVVTLTWWDQDDFCFDPWIMISGVVVFSTVIGYGLVTVAPFGVLFAVNVTLDATIRPDRLEVWLRVAGR